MGWNCPACGRLLKSETPSWQAELREHRCENCGSRFIIVEGKQPRTYLNSVVICIDDGEKESGLATSRILSRMSNIGQ